MALLLGVVGISAPAALGAPFTSTRVAGIDVDAATIPQLQAAMNRHRLSAVQLTQFYIHRIKKLNPKLHAVITVSPRALADARAADRARRAGDRRPLLGIPVLVKDNVGTTGMANTAGSWALAGSTPPDAFLIRQLRAAGAIILAKANLSEWANFRSAPSSSGWSGIGGQTNMPYVLDRNPCGSSSGTGAGVAADLATVGIGTETDGSIVCPSGANGIVGIKPTLGLVSRAGVIPLSAEQDTAGPMTRNVTDAAVVLGAMTGIDPNDPATAAQAGHAFTNYTQFLDADALEGARIGVWRAGTYNPTVSPEVHAILNATIAALEAQGATIVDNTSIPIEDAYGPEFEALLCEFKDDIAAYLETYTGAAYPKTLQDLIDFNDAHPGLEGPWNSLIFEWAQETGGRSDPACTEARETANAIARAAITETLATNDLDAIIGPTNGPAWLTDPVNGDLGGDFSTFVGSSSPSAISGWASMTIPAGYAGPLPVGVTFIGARWDEPKLLGFAYDLEQATDVRVPPRFLATSSSAAAKVTGKPSKVHANQRAMSGLR
ncbi:MAG: amidase [Chloroflexi bacterium]|nr:amidase [Chloroflexota bacterium]